jgi:hypothetical protein
MMALPLKVARVGNAARVALVLASTPLIRSVPLTRIDPVEKGVRPVALVKVEAISLQN